VLPDALYEVGYLFNIEYAGLSSSLVVYAGLSSSLVVNAGLLLASGCSTVSLLRVRGRGIGLLGFQSGDLKVRMVREQHESDNGRDERCSGAILERGSEEAKQ
jgi:hypothetical protein